MDIEIAIERIVLEGIVLSRGQHLALRSAIEAELGRLLVEGGLSASLVGDGFVPRLAGGEIHLPQGSGPADPVQLGAQIAQAVYGGLGK